MQQKNLESRRVILNREQRLEIFDNLFELSPVMETYVGNKIKK